MSNYGTFRQIFPFCYRCTFLKRCDLLRSVPFYYRSPFRFINVLRSMLLRSPFRFFCHLHLNGTVSPPFFLVTCNTYVRTGYVHRHDSDKTYACCWLAHVSVASLVLRWLRRTAITRSRWLYTYHHRQGLKPGDLSRNLQHEESRQPDEVSPSS